MFGDHLRRIPTLYYAIALGYVVLRVAAILGTKVSGGFPDSATYRATPGGPSLTFVSLTGHAVRPWVVPLFYKILPSDNLRAGAQVAISIVAWLVLAATITVSLRHKWVRGFAFVVVLAISCTTPVLNWDRAILSESLSISLVVLALAAWIRFVRKPTRANSVAVVVSSGLWMFTKLGLFPLVAIAALIIAVTGVRAGQRGLRVAVVVGLAFACIWVASTTSATDKAYRVVDGMSTSEFDNLFAMRLRFSILNDPSQLAWYRAHGMPDPSGLQPYVRTSPSDDGYDTWTAFLSAYSARTDLATWVENKGRGVFLRYVITHPRQTTADFIHDLPYILDPPRHEIVYAADVRDVLPTAVQSLLFETASEEVPTPAGLGDIGLLFAAFVVLAIVARRRAVDRSMVAVAVVGFALAVLGAALGWIVSPAEIARHAVPEAVLIRATLWFGIFLLADALLAPHVPRVVDSDRRGGRQLVDELVAEELGSRRDSGSIDS
ncbi:MAG: hypothetical protein E6G39_04450 [Actinobacteria bacterium]|nr:MAG: hypothetical protein E6G39_04450 [Actinomycetota bacterium]